VQLQLRVRLIGLLAFALVVTWLFAHEGHVALPSRGAQVDAEKGYIILSRESREALDVRSAEISTTPLPDMVLAYVETTAPWGKHVYVSARVPGRIQRVFVQAGDLVSEGQAIAEIQSAELENLQADILRTETELTLASKVLEGLKKSGGGIPVRSVLDAENQVQQLEVGVVVNRAKWQGLGLEVERYENLRRDPMKRLAVLPVRSSLTGTIIHIDLSPGKMVDVGEHLVEVIDVSKVLAKIGVLETDSAKVSIGQEVSLRLTALPGEVFPSKIVGIDQALDPNTNQNAVWAELDNKPGQARFLPGMTGQASISLPVPVAARVVPATALIDDGLAQYVLVEEANTERQSEYRRKNVVVIRRQGKWVEIQAPELFPGDRIVTQAAHELGGFFVPGVLKLSPEAVRTLDVQTAVASGQTIDRVIRVDGRVELHPANRVVVSSPLAGQIARLHVKQNAPVEKGQVIAEIFSLEFQNIQLDLIREKLTFDLLETQWKNLLSGGSAVPQRGVLEAEAAKTAAGHRVENLKRRLELAGLTGEQIVLLLAQKKLIETIPIRTTSAGTVVRFDKILGQGIKAEEPLFEVHDLRDVRMEAFLAEREVALILTKQKARIRMVSEPKRVLTGTVAPSTRMVTADDQSLSVWLDLDGATGLKRGQLANVTIIINSRPVALAVPRTALSEEAARRYVFVLQESGEWERRLVEVGALDDRFIEIRRGLRAGEKIAVQGVAGLQTAYAAIR
jgi:cobalt-zinc-cadmium efflux system membrane fusion protein